MYGRNLDSFQPIFRCDYSTGYGNESSDTMFGASLVHLEREGTTAGITGLHLLGPRDWFTVHSPVQSDFFDPVRCMYIYIYIYKHEVCLHD